METLQKLFVIKCIHPFYKDIIPLQLEVLDLDVKKKYGLLIRRKGNDFLIYGDAKKKDLFFSTFTKVKLSFPKLLLKAEVHTNHQSSANESNHEEDVIDFKLNVIDARFYYVTNGVVDDPSSDIKRCYQDDIFYELKDITIHFSVKVKKFEYVITTKGVLPSYHLKEVNNKLQFDKLESDSSTAHFISHNAINLCAQYDLQLELVERSQFGEKKILNKIAFPDVSSLSVLFPYDAITKYYTI